MWNAGGLFDFDSTVVFHKVETMRVVQSRLGLATGRTAHFCVRLILTLCITEVSILSVS